MTGLSHDGTEGKGSHSLRPSLAVVIICWNDGPRAISCIEVIGSWSALHPTIIVVDNASGDGSADRIEQRCPEVVLLRLRENRGFGGGNNEGIRKALEIGSETILLLNSDASIGEGSLSRLLRTLDKEPETGIVGPLLDEGKAEGRTLYGGGRNVALYPGTRVTISCTGRQREGTENVLTVEYVPGTVFLARADVFKAVGFLDEEYFFGGEIADFCTRAKKKGIGCAVDTCATASHGKEGTPAPRSTLHSYYSLRNRFLYVRKHCRGLKVPLLFWWGTLGAAMAARSLLSCQRERARALLLAVRDGFVGRWGNRNELFDA